MSGLGMSDREGIRPSRRGVFERGLILERPTDVRQVPRSFPVSPGPVPTTAVFPVLHQGSDGLHPDGDHAQGRHDAHPRCGLGGVGCGGDGGRVRGAGADPGSGARAGAPDTLSTRNNLAAMRGLAEDAAGAAAALAELAPIYARVLGPNHPNTVAIRNNLAYWQGQAESS